MAKRARGPTHPDWGKPTDFKSLVIPRELKFVDHGDGLETQWLLHDDSKTFFFLYSSYVAHFKNNRMLQYSYTNVTTDTVMVKKPLPI